MRDLPPPGELGPFYQAITTNDMDAVQAYMRKYKHIANFELTSIFGTEKLNTVFCAVYSGSMEMLDLMVKQRVSTNLRIQPGGYTALHLAIQLQRRDMIEYLLNHNADPRITGEDGNNVFHFIAQSFRDFETTRLLLKYAPDLLNQKRQSEDAYPLTLLLTEQYNDDQYDAPGVLELLELFLSNGADVSLLFEGCDIFDPFAYFITSYKNDYLALLLSYLQKKLPNLSEGLGYGLSYLHVAIRCGNFDIVPQLIPYIEDINSVNISGQTALHYAAAHSTYTDAGVIKMLLENGADKTIRGDDGLTAYDMYITDNANIDEEILNMLRE
jgi:ankyrin repeat protein